jgi:solute carrier family 13 (sodium-dependent dicarboxylate transporter), member 2/3/5
VAAGWILHPLIGDALGAGAITDTGLAIAGAVALFAIPADWRTRTFLLDWPTARKVPWEILILFGGGLSLAQGIDKTGLAAWLGGGLEFLTAGPAILLIAGVTVFVILLTELTSNTATAAAFLPVAGALAVGADLAPLLLAAPVALAASAAFMLPVATPPNAIVFGSGHVTLPQMMRAGIYLNVAGVIVITTALMLLADQPMTPAWACWAAVAAALGAFAGLDHGNGARRSGGRRHLAPVRPGNGPLDPMARPRPRTHRARGRRMGSWAVTAKKDCIY